MEKEVSRDNWVRKANFSDTGRGLAKASSVDIDALLAVFAAAQGHLLPRLQVVKFFDQQRAIRRPDHDAIHAGILQQNPFPHFELKIFGKDRGGVVMVRGDACLSHRGEDHQRGACAEAAG